MREPKRDTPYFRWGLTLFCSLSAVILVYVLLTRMSGVMGFVQTLWKTLSPVVYGLAIAYLLCYPMNFFEGLLLRAFHLPAYDPLVTEEKPAAKRRKLCRGLAVLITFILVGLLIWAFIAMLLPRLVQSITQLISSTDDYYQTVEGWVTRILEKNPELVDYATGFLGRFETYLTQFFTGTIAPRVQRLLTTLTYSVIGVVKSTFNIIVGFIIAVYVLCSKDEFLLHSKKLVRALFSDLHSFWIFDVTSHAHEYFGKFLTGKIVDSLIIGVLCFIGVSILKMPYALLISVIVGLTNIIPFFGPFLGAIPTAFLILMDSPLKCLYFIIFILALQQLDGNVIGPKVMGSRVNVSAFWIIVSILVFGKLLGFVGMVIGVPCFATIQYIVTTRVERRLAHRGLTERQVSEGEYPDLHSKKSETEEPAGVE